LLESSSMIERRQHVQEVTWSEYLSDPWSGLEEINPEISKSREVLDLINWYDERVKVLPYMDEETTSLTDGKNWKAEFVIPGILERSAVARDVLLGRQPELQVQRVFRPDNMFYVIAGRKYTKYKVAGRKEILFSWTQPVIISKEDMTDTNILGEDLRIPVNGFLGTIPDTDGNILMSVEQEATAETPNHAIVRLAVQASAGKIALMRGGKPEADKGLAELLSIYSGGEIEQLLDMAEMILPIPPEDTNRDIKHNLLLLMPEVRSGSELHKKLVEDSKRKWLSPLQRAVVNAARVTNDHTITAVSFDRDVRLLRNFTSHIAEIESGK